MPYQRIRMALGHDIRGERTVSADAISAFLRTVSGSFPGFSVSTGLGYWAGSAEDCTVIEILSDAELALPMVRALARSFAALHDQDCVLVTAEPVPIVEFVGAV